MPRKMSYPLVDRACQHCGDEFKGRSTQKYCTKKCQQKANRRRFIERHAEEKICVVCGNPFTAKDKRVVTCSYQCGGRLSHWKTGPRQIIISEDGKRRRSRKATLQWQRAREEKYPLLNDKEWLEKKYLEERKSLEEMARLVGCSRTSVTSALKRHFIPTRN